jgi:hypothetical protein
VITRSIHQDNTTSSLTPSVALRQWVKIASTLISKEMHNRAALQGGPIVQGKTTVVVSINDLNYSYWLSFVWYHVFVGAANALPIFSQSFARVVVVALTGLRVLARSY